MVHNSGEVVDPEYISPHGCFLELIFGHLPVTDDDIDTTPSIHLRQNPLRLVEEMISLRTRLRPDKMAR